MPDLITQRWFDPLSVKVLIEAGVPNVFDTLDLVRISGAFAHSTLTVRNTGTAIRLDVEHHAVRKHWRELFFDLNDNCWVIYNQKFRVHEDYWGQDLAGRSIAVQVQTARNIGVGKLVAYAEGNHQSANRLRKEERWSGYWVWPRMGFDADIPTPIKPLLKAPYRDMTRLSELMSSEEGQQEWYLHGDSLRVEFDLRAGSTSWKIHERYTSKRDIRV